MNNQFTLIEMNNNHNRNSDSDSEFSETSISLELSTPPAPRGKKSPSILITPSPPRKSSIKRTTHSNISTGTFSSPPPSPLFDRKVTINLPPTEDNYKKKKKLPTTPRPKTIKDTPLKNTPIKEIPFIDRVKNTCLSYFK